MNAESEIIPTKIPDQSRIARDHKIKLALCFEKKEEARQLSVR